MKSLIISRQFSQFSCYSYDTPKTFLSLFDNTSGKPLLVLDTDSTLVGIISSGDVRRAIQAGTYTDDTTAAALCNKTPLVANISDDPTTLNRLLNQDTLCLPLLSANRRVEAYAYLDYPALTVGNKSISFNSSALLTIAEIGVNHNGSYELARELVSAAFESGFDAVKFQIRTDDTYSTNSFDSEDLGVQYIRKELDRCHLSFQEYKNLFEYSRTLGLLVICTPFDQSALQLVANCDIDAIKIASCDLTNHPLLLAARETALPIIISTGMSYESEIISCTELFELRSNVAFLHCNSTYPAPAEDLNLRYIKRLQQITSRVVGYSSHDGTVASSVAALAFGSRIFEVHITHDKKQTGTDHMASLELADLPDYIKTLKYCADTIGDDLPRKPTQGELNNRLTLGKSLAFSRNLLAGQLIKEDDLMLRSPANGFSWVDRHKFIGRELINAVTKGQLITDESFEKPNSSKYYFKFPPSIIDGIPVRYHDFNKLAAVFDVKLYEFHLSSNDLLLQPTEYIDKSLLLGKNVVFHAVEQYDDGFILDFGSEVSKIVAESEFRFDQLLGHIENFSSTFSLQGPVKVIVNPGGFTVGEPCSPSKACSKTVMIAETMRKIQDKHPSTQLLVQTMPPYPWHQGGQSFHNVLVTPESVRSYIELSGLDICLDISHSAMAANNLSFCLYKFIEEFLPFSPHLHISDAASTSQEGLQIGDGSLDFSTIFSTIKSSGRVHSFIPEIWQGHLHAGQGFGVALKRLSSFSLSS